MVGVIVSIVSFRLAGLAVRAPGGSPGRGMAAWGIVLSILGLAFCLFVWGMSSILPNDTIL